MSMKTQGVVERPKGSGMFYVRIKHRGTERFYKVASKAQGKAVYTRLRAEIIEDVINRNEFAH